jgi:hypothetical protein
MNMKALSRFFRIKCIVATSFSLIALTAGAFSMPASAAPLPGEMRFMSIEDSNGSSATGDGGVTISGTSVGVAYYGQCDGAAANHQPVDDGACDNGSGTYYHRQYTNLYNGYVSAGHTFTVNYKLTSGWPNYTPISGSNIFLRINPKYSAWGGVGAAHLSYQGTPLPHPDWGNQGGSCGFSTNDCADLLAVTNSLGIASWTLTDLTADGAAESRPSPLSSMVSGVDTNGNKVSFSMEPSLDAGNIANGVDVVDGSKTLEIQPPDNISDAVTVHVMQNAAGIIPASETLTATSGLIGSHNDSSTASSFVSHGWYKSGVSYMSAYAYQGSAISLTYHVVDSSTGTSAVAGTSVSLRINKQYSGSNAKFSVPSGVNSAGSYDGGDGKVLTGNTDASGNVTFSLVNSNTYCESEAMPADVNGLATGTGGIFSQIALMTGDPLQEVISFIEIHFVKNPANEVKCTYPAHKADLVISQASISVDGNDVTCNATPGTLPFEGERFFNEQGYPDGIFRS